MPFDRETATPGDYVLTMDDSGGSIAKSPALRANLHRYQLYRNLLLGGNYVIRPPAETLHPMNGGGLPDGSYLVRLPKEKIRRNDGKDPFIDRRDRSFHQPYGARIIDTYVATFFRQPVDRSGIRAALPDVYADVDLRGNDAVEFLRTGWRLALDQGWVCALTDMPRIAGPFASEAARIDAGLRPYARWILPERLWQWELDPTTGEFLWACVRESRTTWRCWTPTTWQLIDADATILEAGEHQFRRVPLDLLICDEADDNDPLAPFGMSALAQVADMELEATNQWSLLARALRVAGYQFLHVAKDIAELKTGAAPQQTVGEEFMVFYDAAVSWISPDMGVMQGLRNHLESLEAAMLKAGGVHRRSQDSIESHSGLALSYEYEPRNDMVKHRAGRLRAFESRFWRHVGEMANTAITEEDLPRYPEDITTRPLDVELHQCEQIAKVYGSYATAPAPIQRYIDLKVGRIIQYDAGHMARGEEIVKELAELDHEKPETPEPFAAQQAKPLPDELKRGGPQDAADVQEKP